MIGLFHAGTMINLSALALGEMISRLQQSNSKTGKLIPISGEDHPAALMLCKILDSTRIQP